MPGLTIHLPKDDAYRASPVSRAFPGWRAKDAHEALNEPVPSACTHAMVERLDRTLGAREGTWPDDHPLMHSMREQSRAEGEVKDRAEGLAKGRGRTVRQTLRSLGIGVSAGFPADAPGFDASFEDAVVAAALACRGEEDSSRPPVRRPPRPLVPPAKVRPAGAVRQGRVDGLPRRRGADQRPWPPLRPADPGRRPR